MPEIKANDDIVQLVLDCLLKQNETILENDILVITQKIVSKAENRTVDINSITSTIEANELALSLNKDPKLVQLILNESQSIVKLDLKRGIIITENKIGHISANAGIDFSNVKGKTNVTLLPENPDKSAKLIHKNLLNKLDVKNIGVIISDTFGRPWRIGQTNISIGSFGIDPFENYINNEDMYGEKLNSTNICIDDELAGGAEILMKKTLNVPIVIVRGLSYKLSLIHI